MLKLKEYRLKIGLTQSEIAFKLGMNQQSYSRYENGTTEPNIETLIKIADFFQISIDDLLGRKCNVINIFYHSDLKKQLLKELAEESDDKIQRVADFYSAIRSEGINHKVEHFKNTSNEITNTTFLVNENATNPNYPFVNDVNKGSIDTITSYLTGKKQNNQDKNK